MLIKGYKKKQAPASGKAETAKQAVDVSKMTLPDVDELLGPDPDSPPAQNEPDFAWQPGAPDRRSGERDERRKGFRRGEDNDVIINAQQQAEQLKEQARQEGFEQGFQQGMQTAGTLLEDMRQQLSRFQQLEEQAKGSLVNEVVPLAIKVAEKILHTEVSCDPELILHMAQALLDATDPKQKQVTLKVHPDDAKVVKHEADNNRLWQLNGRRVVVWEDPGIERGSAMVETEAGQIDATFKTQLELARKLFAVDEESLKAQQELAERLAAEEASEREQARLTPDEPQELEVLPAVEGEAEQAAPEALKEKPAANAAPAPARREAKPAPGRSPQPRPATQQSTPEKTPAENKPAATPKPAARRVAPKRATPPTAGGKG